MITITERHPNKTVQQLNATPCNEVGRLGRVVSVTDEDYTVDPRDDLIVLAVTTSTGNYTLTFPSSLPDNTRVMVVMPGAPGGSDIFWTNGVAPQATFDSAGQTATVLMVGGAGILEGAAGAPIPVGALTGTSVTATTGNITATAGDVVLSDAAGKVVLSGGTIIGLGSYANNAAAVSAGLPAGALFIDQTDDIVKRVV